MLIKIFHWKQEDQQLLDFFGLFYFISNEIVKLFIAEFKLQFLLDQLRHLFWSGFN